MGTIAWGLRAIAWGLGVIGSPFLGWFLGGYLAKKVESRRKRWELMFEASKKMLSAHNTLRFQFLFQEFILRDSDQDTFKDHRGEALRQFNKARDEFEEVVLLVNSVCSKKTIKAFNDFSVAVTQFEPRLASGEADVWKKHSGELNTKFVAAQKAIRKELGIHIPRDTKQ